MRGLVLVGLQAMLPACHQASSTLRVGSQKGGTRALMLASGALSGARYAVEWSEFPAAQPLLEAIGSGAVDVGVAGDAPFLFAYESGRPIRAIAAQRADPPLPRALAIVVPADSSIHRLEDLREMRIATTRGSIGHLLLLRVLERAGWSPADVRTVFLMPSDSAAALRSGAIDAWATWEPYVALAEAGDARVVVDGSEFANGYGLDVASTHAIQERGALLSDFISRESRALEWAAAHLDEYAALLARETGLPPAVARVFASRTARLRVALDERLIQDLQQVLDSFERAGELHAGRPLSEALNPQVDRAGAQAVSAAPFIAA